MCFYTICTCTGSATKCPDSRKPESCWSLCVCTKLPSMKVHFSMSMCSCVFLPCLDTLPLHRGCTKQTPLFCYMSQEGIAMQQNMSQQAGMTRQEHRCIDCQLLRGPVMWNDNRLKEKSVSLDPNERRHMAKHVVTIALKKGQWRAQENGTCSSTVRNEK